MTERTILDLALEALRPIAKVAKQYEANSLLGLRWENSQSLCCHHTWPKGEDFTVGDLRRAAAAVEAIEKMKGDADG